MPPPGRRLLRPWLIRALVLLAGLGGEAPVARAAGVVGTGTALSCTEAVLDLALAGGGSVTFDCGPAAVAIVVTAAKTPTGTTTVDGGGLITLSGGNAFQVFRVNPGVTLTLSSLTLARGKGFDGGCLYNGGTLNVTNVVIERCAADHDGGGIFNDVGGQTAITGSTIRTNTASFDCGGVCDLGVLTVSNSTVSGNMATHAAGGIGTVGMVTLTDTVVSGNSTSGDGGGLYNNTSMTLTGVTLSGNSAANGGGLYNNSGTATMSNTTISASSGGGLVNKSGGTVTLSNTTISENSTGNSRIGLDNWGTATLSNTTISGNSQAGIHAYAGTTTLTNVTISGNFLGVYRAAGTTTLKNTIVANNTTNCLGAITNDGFNLSSDLTCGFGGTRDGVVVLLGPLADNGGPTLTHRLLLFSPAIDGGTGAGCPATDQRGVTRPRGLACDVGAYEVAPGDLAVGLANAPDPVARGAPLTYTATVTNPGGVLAGAVTLTDTLPASVTFISATASQGACTGTATVTCVLGSLDAGGSATVTIVVTPGSVGPLSNIVSVAAADPDVDLANNTATATTSVHLPPLDLQLNATTFHPGDQLVLTVTLTPGGITGLVDAYAVLRLPSGAFFSLQLGGGAVPGIVPLATGFAPFAVSGELLRYTFTGLEPLGNYAFLAALAQTGTANVLGVIDEAPFTVSP